MPALESIRIYPIKSCAGHAVAAAETRRRGLAGDRRLMLVDAAGHFVTGRRYPQLTQIAVQQDSTGLVCRAPGRSDLNLPEASSRRRRVVVWKSEVDARCYADEVDAWFSAIVGADVHLVGMDEHSSRPVDPEFAESGDQVSFADGYPLLLISRTAVTALNERLLSPVKMANFRPNLIVSGTPPHAEDGWHRIRIGDVEFDIVKPCARCVFTTVDPDTGEKRSDGEPLRTLAGYRRSNRQIEFGQNLIARGVGTIRAGDEVHVIR